MAIFNSIFSYQIHVVRIGYGHGKRREGCLGLVLGLVSSLENTLKAENIAPSHLYSHRSTIHSAPLLLACRVARCPVLHRTVRYFGSLSGVKMKEIPDNACVRYFEPSWYSPFFLQSVAR